MIDKILITFSWWEDLHGFWRTNPAFNTVFTTTDPGQDFAAEAVAHFSGNQSTSQAAPAPLVDGGWVPGGDHGDIPEAEVGAGEDEINGDRLGDDEEEADLDQNVPDPSGGLEETDNDGIFSPPSSHLTSSHSSSSHIQKGDALRTLTSHASQASGHTKGKAKAPPRSLACSSVRAPSADASATRKRSRDVGGSDIGSRVSDLLGAVLDEIWGKSEADTNTKQMKIEVHVFSKEIKSRDQRDQREHEMKLKMVENDHEQSMASEKTKQLELEIR